MEITEKLNGHIVPRVAHGLPVECDYCSEELERGQKVTLPDPKDMGDDLKRTERQRNAPTNWMRKFSGLTT